MFRAVLKLELVMEMQDQENKRHHVAKELLSSESSYLEKLKFLNKVIIYMQSNIYV